jgi:hypothetical protein
MENLEEFDIWWVTVCGVVEENTGVHLKKRDEEFFRPDYEAGRCAYEVGQAYADTLLEGG